MVYSIYMTYGNLFIKGLGNRVFWVLLESSLTLASGYEYERTLETTLGAGYRECPIFSSC